MIAATPSARQACLSTADHSCQCHVEDGARGRRRDGVYGASNGGVDGGVEKRALRAVVEGGEEHADTRM